MIEELGEEPPAEADAELSRIMQEIDRISEARNRWSPEDMARSGIMIGLDYDGVLRVERGLVKVEDCKDDGTRQTPEEATSTERKPKPDGAIPDTLIEDLTAHRTAALQEMLAQQPELAFTALLYMLVLRTFYDSLKETCLDITPVVQNLKPFSERVGESKAAAAMSLRHKEWRGELPDDEEGVWRWLLKQDFDSRLALLGYCTAVTANAVKRRYDRDDCARLAHADLLAAASGLDMADWWEATTATYFERVPKALILKAVAEGVSKDAAENISKLKKDAMAARAEERLAGRRWLPRVLRPRSAPDVAAREESQTA